jgi:uncharacterized protein (TIGR02145 family)
MKAPTTIGIFCFTIAGILVFFTTSCKKKGDDNTVPIPKLVPMLTTDSVRNITKTSATIDVNISSQGTDPVMNRGVCWSKSPYPTLADSHTNIGSGIGRFSDNISSLEPNTRYYVIAYATNSGGTGYGGQIIFSTQGISGTVTDIDGNIYQTLTVGTQTWMVENLRTTRFNDGSQIPISTDNNEWMILHSSAFCWYNNDSASYDKTYGVIYNWYAINTGKLAPIGWHVPSDDDWLILLEYLDFGDYQVAGGKMKSVGTIEAQTGLWHEPNTAASNSSGYSAVPGGYRGFTGAFSDMGNLGGYWSSTEFDGGNAGHYNLYHYLGRVLHDVSPKYYGFSVRCVKD